MRNTTLIALVALYAASAHAAEPIIGKARIIDGDTIEVSGARIRLEGIDAPERGQECCDRLRQPYDCGGTAVRTLVDLTKEQAVSFEPVGSDKYRRTLAICRLPTGVDLNAELVRQGRAVAFRRHSERSVGEEDSARRSGAGHWAGTFEYPGCYRAQGRGDACQDELPLRLPPRCDCLLGERLLRCLTLNEGKTS